MRVQVETSSGQHRGWRFSTSRNSQAWRDRLPRVYSRSQGTKGGFDQSKMFGHSSLKRYLSEEFIRGCCVLVVVLCEGMIDDKEILKKNEFIKQVLKKKHNIGAK